MPVFEQLNGILLYPVQYEGQECSRNVFYTGAAVNQQAIPAVDYLMDQVNVKRWVLEGTDYVYPRTTNKILEAYLKSKGVAPDDLMINYTPFGYSDWQAEVAKIKSFGSAGKKTAVVSTINGDANVPFYKELGNQGIKATDIPSVAFSVGEQELAGIDTRPLVGHLAAWNYFQSVDTPLNKEVVAAFKKFVKDDKRVFNDPMEAHYIGFNMWVKAVEKAGIDRSRRGHRRDDRRRASQSVRRLRDDDAEPSPDEAGADRRGAGQRPVQRRLADAGAGGGPTLVALSAGEQEPDRRLAAADVLRQLRRRRRQVSRACTRREFAEPGQGPPALRYAASGSAPALAVRWRCRRPLRRAPAATRSRRLPPPISMRWRSGVRRWPSPATRAPPRSSMRCATASSSPGAGRARMRRSISAAQRGLSMRAPAPRSRPRCRSICGGSSSTIRCARAIETAEGALGLFAKDRAKRQVAAEALFQSADPAALPLIERALKPANPIPPIADLLHEARAAALLKSGTGAVAERLAAVAELAARPDLSTRSLLASLQGQPPAVAAAIGSAIRDIDRRLQLWGLLEAVYYGISLGAVLLLAASGLAITFGVMGVINMAHGEMVMIGAYTTFVVQRLIAACAPALDQLGLCLRRSGGVSRRRRARHGHRALPDPLPLRPAAGNPARHLGAEPDPAAGGAQHLRADQPGRDLARLDERRGAPGRADC